MTPLPFITFWLLSSGLMATLVFRRELAESLPEIRRHWRAWAAIGICHSLNAFGNFYALSKLTAPLREILNTSSVVFAVALGMVFLRERRSRAELLCSLGAVGGIALAVLPTLTDSGEAVSGLLPWCGIALLATFANEVSALVFKASCGKTHPGTLMPFRNLTPALIGCALLAARGDFVSSIPRNPAFYVMAFVGPFLGVYIAYRSFAWIDLSKVAPFNALRPLVVWGMTAGAVGVGIFAASEGRLEALQWLGGGIVVASILALALVPGRPSGVA